MRNLKRIFAVVVLAFSASTAFASGCPAVNDMVWTGSLSGVQGAITAAIMAMQKAFEALKVYNAQMMQGAVRIITSQTNASTNNSIQLNMSAKQARAGLDVEISNRKAVMQTLADFGPETGQGFDPCGEQKRSKDVAVAIGEAGTDMQEKVIREIDAGPGKYVADRGAVIADRYRQARTTYCTADEAKAGLCSAPGPMAGKDVDASNFFTTAAAGSDQDKAKTALLNHLFGVPQVALSKAAAATPTGQAFLEQKRQQDAVASVAQASLKTIQAWTTARSGSGSDAQSVLDALGAKINTYAGGNNHDAWATTLASQSERGLLISLAKMMATDLYMQELRYKSAEREEAIVATRLALHAGNAAQGDAQVQNGIVRSKVQP